ncbi:MAG: thrombospondin type 3 repeat-containing protein [Patescibacteria group bacterium]
MKEIILAHWRTLTATLFSVALIVGVYIIARGVESPPTALASTESALLQAIATKDTDGDGLSDWEEALYGTSPSTVDTSNLGMTDGEAVARGLIVPISIADVPTATPSLASIGADGLPPAPAEGTLTAAFAKTFFALFVKAKQASGGADLSESELQKVSDEALSSLSAFMDVAPDFKSAKDLKVSGSGPDALKDFAVRAEGILLKNTSTATTSEINYLKYAVENNDVEALSYIASIAKMYRNSAIGLATLSVPAELVEDNLAIINAMIRISQIATDFTKVSEDPLVTILALKQYPQAVLSLGNAFIRIGTIYKTADISLSSGAPGSAFVNLISDTVAKQQSAKRP